MSTLHTRVARLARQHPELRHHLTPLLRKHALDRNAGFLDFLKRKPIKVKNKTGILPSIVLPGQPAGPLARLINPSTIRRPLLDHFRVKDWEVKDSGDTLVVDIDANYQRPDRPDPDLLPINIESLLDKALQPLAREISSLIGAPAVVTAKYDMDRGLMEGEDPQITVPYQIIIKMPRGTAQEQLMALSPSPARVASRYARRR